MCSIASFKYEQKVAKCNIINVCEIGKLKNEFFVYLRFSVVYGNEGKSRDFGV